MAELKTKPTSESAEACLNGLSDENKRRDAFTILEWICLSLNSL